MLDSNELKARIEYSRTKAGYNKQEIAEKMGMHPNTLRVKLNEPLKYTLGELLILKDLFLADSIDDLFRIRKEIS